MRVRLHERLVAQRRKLQDMERQSQHDYVVFNQLEQDMRQKEKLLEQLRDDMRQLQQRLSATEGELQKTRKDHAAAKQIVDVRTLFVWFFCLDKLVYLLFLGKLFLDWGVAGSKPVYFWRETAG